MTALYDVISGPAGKVRDRDRFLSLFVPDARLMPVRHAKEGAGADVLVLSPEQFYAIAEPAFEKGFFEHGIHHTVDSFGDMVHVFSTYESRRASGDAKPFARGINSIQLLKDGSRYWVITILWDEEKPGLELPQKYLP